MKNMLQIYALRDWRPNVSVSLHRFRDDLSSRCANSNPKREHIAVA